MNILNLDKGISLYEINNEFFFDLEDIAGRMGYTRPKDAVRDFLGRNADFHPQTASCGFGSKLYCESALYLFLMRSSVPKAKEWQIYVCTEVLPLARKVGIKAMKELAAITLLKQNRLSPDLYSQVQALVGEDTQQFLQDQMAYRVLGYLPPSDVKPEGWSLKKFWDFVESEGICNFSTMYCPRYHNSYTLDGKWYAFKPFSVIEKIQQITCTEDIF
jgi:prophage antirepressor-like protein